MSQPPDDAGGTPRRTFLAFLTTAALAPLASLTASCATVRVGAAPAGPGAGPSQAPAAPDPLEALRAVALPDSAEPAFVFRAVLPPGGGRDAP